MFRHITARVSASVVAASVAFALVATVPAYAAPNPRNHGHHYGQLKHRKHHPGPVPTPSPKPKPVPTPAPKPVTGGGSHPAGNKPVSSPHIPTLNLALPNVQPDTRTVASLPRPVPEDPFWWLVLGILPSLAAVMFIALRGLLVGLMRRPVAAPRPAAQPAAV